MSIIRVLTSNGTIMDVTTDLPPAEFKLIRATNPKITPEHGTYGRWLSPHKCRCDLCHRAYLDETTHLRNTIIERLGADRIPHGTYYAYCKYRCRCSECVTAGREYARSKAEAKNARRRAQPRKPPTPEQRAKRNAQMRQKRREAKLQASLGNGGHHEGMPELRSRS